jgi:hypothetical protein
LQWDLKVNGTLVGGMIQNTIHSKLLDSPALIVVSAQRIRMNVLGALFPIGIENLNITQLDEKPAQVVSEEMQTPVSIVVEVLAHQ